MNPDCLSTAQVTAASLSGRAEDGIHTLCYSLAEVIPYINWLYFFHTWGFPARFAAIAHIYGCDSCRASWLASFPVEDRAKAAEAMQLHKEAGRMLTWLDKQGFKTHVRFGLFECNSDGEDILIYKTPATTRHEGAPTGERTGSTTLSFLRQQTAPYLCIADFIRPVNTEGKKDRMGIFVACADEAIEHSFRDEDDYRHLLCQTLADRLAEAATERAHQAIRRIYWGYAPGEQLSIDDLHAERFQGIRPAVGYPSLPDQSLNFDLDRLIDFSAIGIRLTESGAMQPHASVSGLMIAHPEAHYFTVGPIGADQLSDYAKRKGRSLEEMRPYLAAVLHGLA